MAFCPNCGAPAAGKFCANCGATLSEDPSKAPQAWSRPSSAAMAPTVAATLAYIPVFIPAILFLVWAPYSKDKTVRFHAFQSLFLQIGWIVLAMVLGIVVSMVSWQLWVLLSRLMNLAVILTAAYLMWKTYQNQKVVLPVIGDLAQKQA